MTSSTPCPQPATKRTCAAAIIGAIGHVVEVRADISSGPAAFTIAGLPESSVRETRDRVYAAVLNSGQPWPAGAVAVNLQPNSLPKHGGGFDLPIAVAVLTAAGAVPADAPDRCLFMAELGLDGTLRPVRGVAPAMLATARAGCTRAVVAEANAAEAAIVPGLAAVPCTSLRAVRAWLRGEPLPPRPEVPTAPTALPAPGTSPVASLAQLGVAPQVRQALEVSAAGRHHLCLTGPHDAPIAAVAAGLAALMPTLSSDQTTEVTAIHSVAGLLGSGHELITRPPLRSPHHTATRPAILGGGHGIIRPGDAALAHRGVLFLDDAPEFSRDVLASLRHPLQTGEVVIARYGSIVRFPARFTLVVGMSPCPCGARPDCTCSPLQARRYRSRLVGELGSYIALWLNAHRPGPALTATAQDDPDAKSVARVAAAQDRARHRLRRTPWNVNADIPGAELRRSYLPPAEALAPLSRAVDLGEISTRAAHQVIRVAWTLADLVGLARPGPDECGQALAFHLGVAG